MVYEYATEDGERFFRTFHRLIAEKTAREYFNDPAEQFEAYREILSRAILSHPTEARIIDTLLIEHLGPNAKQTKLRYNQQRELFDIASRDVRRRPIIHHWGILEADNYYYDKAEELFKEALQLPKETEAYGGESDQNIITSLGSLYSHRAQEAFKQGRTTDAEEHIESAARQFLGARYGFFPNVHAYHAHAYMHFSLGRLAITGIERLEHYNSALDLLEFGKANTNPESHQILYELETVIWSQLGDKNKIETSVEELKSRFNSPRGYIIRARLLIHQAETAEVGSDKDFRDAYEIVEECLKKFPRDVEAMRLKLKIYRQVLPGDREGYYAALKDWRITDTQLNFEYLYQLGVYAFLLGYYSDSARHFSDLEKITVGHHLRTRPRDTIRTADSKERDFEGRISQIGPEQGRGHIECTSLPNLRYPLYFSTQVQRFSPAKDQYVKFHIAFNFRGPSALGLRLL